jgi:hypothetical protein
VGAFVRLRFGDVTSTTTTRTAGCNPAFNESFSFEGLSETLEVEGVGVRDGSNETVGAVELNLKEIFKTIHGASSLLWYTLTDDSKSMGKIFLNFTPDVGPAEIAIA